MIMYLCFYSDGLAGYVWDEYRESMRMSTYLLAFVVMDFENISDENFQVWTRADAIGSAKYALSIGPKILRFYEDFFNIQYPLPKVDMISLPDFTAGGNLNCFLFGFRTIEFIFPYYCVVNSRSDGKLGFDHFSRGRSLV